MLGDMAVQQNFPTKGYIELLVLGYTSNDPPDWLCGFHITQCGTNVELENN